ncbi:MAG: hypothetical protein PHI68_00560 [Candidatus Cloacimonetes bacterium]|nr:hypothetical protein [Candidatus Cloacimonadota bacterium]
MSEKGFGKYLPSFLKVAFEVMELIKRDKSHDKNIKRMDKTQEKLATVEHMLVRLEKKIQTNKENVQSVSVRLQIWLLINSGLLIAILLKVLEVY